MTTRLTPTSSTSRVALIGVLAALAIGAAAIPTAAAAVDPGGSDGPSQWAPASELEGSGKAPGLTTGVEALEHGNSAQLWLGYSLLGVGMLVLVYGLALLARTPRSAQQGPAADTATWSGRANRLIGSRARS